MKSSLIYFFSLITIVNINAQSIDGSWKGKLKVMGNELTVVFNVTEADGKYTSTLDSPDQGAYGINVDSTHYSAPDVYFDIPTIRASYKGVMGDDELIEGTFTQSGMSFDLSLSKSTGELEVVRRPQDPEEPYPYISEDVTFVNPKDGNTLAGTFTYPSEGDQFPTLVLISGSGPQNRNEELYNHRPFLVLSDHLTKNGIAVLRYDDRGTGKSTGEFSKATTFDLANDAEAAIKYLLSRDEVNPDFLGLVGHSEGGIIAPMVAARNEDVNMIVLLAATAVRGDQLLNMQRSAMLSAAGMDEERVSKINEFYQPIFKVILDGTELEDMKSQITDYLQQELDENPHGAVITNGLEPEQYIDMVTKQLVTPWMANFVKYDPAPILEKVNCPVLALNGSKDLQVPTEPNLPLIKSRLEKGGNKDVTTKEIPDLNHMFQKCDTGLTIEYAQIEETISPVALEEISGWILEISSK